MFSRHAGLSNPSCVTAAAFSSPNPDRQKHRKIRRARQRRRHLNMMRGALGSIIVPAPQKCREIVGPTLCLVRVRTRIASRLLGSSAIDGFFPRTGRWHWQGRTAASGGEAPLGCMPRGKASRVVHRSQSSSRQNTVSHRYLSDSRHATTTLTLGK